MTKELQTEEGAVRLPRITRLHPLQSAISSIGFSQRQLAALLGVTQQSLQEWLAAARADRDYLVPPRRVVAICRITGQALHSYNPELWPDKSWRVK